MMPIDLTDREHETLFLMTRGFKYSDIAELMGISQRTVVAHIENMKRKLRARTAPHLVARAFAQGLIRMPQPYSRTSVSAK